VDGLEHGWTVVLGGESRPLRHSDACLWGRTSPHNIKRRSRKLKQACISFSPRHGAWMLNESQVRGWERCLPRNRNHNLRRPA
jgi:hypothetical protein